jgi:hypothetical protein
MGNKTNFIVFPNKKRIHVVVFVLNGDHCVVVPMSKNHVVVVSK